MRPATRTQQSAAALSRIARGNAAAGIAGRARKCLDEVVRVAGAFCRGVSGPADELQVALEQAIGATVGRWVVHVVHRDHVVVVQLVRAHVEVDRQVGSIVPRTEELFRIFADEGCGEGRRADGAKLVLEAHALLHDRRDGACVAGACSQRDQHRLQLVEHIDELIGSLDVLRRSVSGTLEAVNVRVRHCALELGRVERCRSVLERRLARAAGGLRVVELGLIRIVGHHQPLRPLHQVKVHFLHFGLNLHVWRHLRDLHVEALLAREGRHVLRKVARADRGRNRRAEARRFVIKLTPRVGATEGELEVEVDAEARLEQRAPAGAGGTCVTQRATAAAAPARRLSRGHSCHGTFGARRRRLNGIA